MKKMIPFICLFFVIALIICLIVFTGSKSFTGKIISIGGNHIIIESNDKKYDGNYNLVIEDDIKIYNTDGDKIAIDQLKENDQIKIYFKGSIKETNPAIIDRVLKIKLV